MAVSSAAAPSPPADAAANAPLAERLFPNNEWVLLVVIAVECLVFGMAGHNFATSGNAFEITRLGVEIGLLALALTPIIVTGGIDLSVGSMMGLAAIVLGWLWHDVGLPMPMAVALTLLLGTIGTAMTYVGISPFWAKAIQGLIILAALVADAALARFERHGSLFGRRAAAAR